MQLKAAAVFLTVLAVGAGAATQISRAALPPSREMTFIDRDSGFALVLQVETAARDAGAFVFRVPGVGLYQGRAGSAMRALSASSVVVQYKGPAILTPQVTSDTTTIPASPHAASITLQAQVNPTQRTAEATLSDGDRHYHLVARNVDKGSLTQILKSFEDATLAADWATLYGIMNKDLRAAYTPSSFAAQGSDQLAAVGRIIALRRISTGDVQTNDNGAMFVIVTYSADLRVPSGSVTTTTYDVYFIPELESWKMWFSAAR